MAIDEVERRLTSAVRARRRGVVILLWVCLVAACGRPPLPPGPAAPSPLVILISLDGWRWDYDAKAPAPRIRELAAAGVRAAGLLPAYPSKTFPNHYSIATGLYPGRHGMVANRFRDSETGRQFERTNRRDVEDPSWWGGDPIWNTAQRGGLIAATMFWPGSEAPVGGMHPRFWREFDETLPDGKRVEQVLAWLDLPPAERPSLITLYFNEVDVLGHWYGPDSPQVRDAITRADGQIGTLLSGLRTRELLDRANIVVVSDHGMAPTTRARTIVVDDYIDLADVEISDINPTLGVTPTRGDAGTIYAALSRAHPNLHMYRREDTPPEWRLRDQPRVAPITGVADEGWVVLRRAEVDEYWIRSPAGGQHGYDPQLESMRGIFIASGPAFRTRTTIAPLRGIDVYNVLAAALGIQPSPNDGDRSVVPSILR